MVFSLKHKLRLNVLIYKKLRLVSLVGMSFLFLLGCSTTPSLLDENLAKFAVGSKEEKTKIKLIIQADEPERTEEEKYQIPIEANRQWWLKLNNKNINDLVQRIINQNYSLKAATTRLAAAKGMEPSAILQLLPKGAITSSSTISKNTGSSQGLYSKEPSSFDYRQNTHNKALNASWDLPLFGQINALKMQTQAEQDYAYWTMRSVESSLVQELITNYYEYGFGVKYLQALHEEINILNEQLLGYKKLYEKGFGNSQDVLKMESILNDTKAQLNTIKSNIANHRQKILTLLSIVDNEKAKDIFLSIESDISFDTHAPNKFEIKEIDANSIRSRPEVALAESKVLSAAAAAGFARAALYPQFTLQGSLTAINGDLDSQGFNKGSSKNLVASIGFRMPLLDWFYLKAQSNLKAAEELAVIFDYRQVIVNSWQETQFQYEDVLTKRATMDLRYAKYTELEVNLKAIENAYSMKLVTEFELYAAKREYIQAKQEYINSKLASINSFFHTLKYV